ncbi:hypothetical protein AUJ15_02075 [Candidatus Micrarchaeota archaeon CG1_02_55_41]|nr:MAG: hypothetical protein AUJ15_02075 [Candidatus Micrarchaeota archaeon CG1_02_55_41]
MVVGAGAMGRHHVRVLNELQEVKRVVVVEPSEKARHAVEERGFEKTFFYGDLDEALSSEKPDCALVVVPTRLHAEIGVKLLGAGIPCLIEKPLASDVKECRKLISATKKNNVLLSVGHLERFNPAVQKLLDHLEMLGDVVYGSAHRYGIPSDRVLDHTFIDQAVHDADLFSYLTGKRPTHVCAVHRNVSKGKTHDLGAALFEYDGFVASVESNRVAPIKTRKMVLVGTQGIAELDFTDQVVTITRLDEIPKKYHEYKTFNELVSRAGQGNELKLFVQKEEPLKLELQSFISHCSNNTAPVVSGEDGLYAVAAAQAAIESAEKGCRVEVKV